MSDSEDVIYGNAAKKLKIFRSKSSKIDRKIDSESTSTSINNIYVISDDDINYENLYNNRAAHKNPDYPSDLSGTELFLTTQRNPTNLRKNRKSKRLSVKKRVSKKPVKQISDSNTDKSPLKGVQTKKKPTKRKTKPNSFSDTNIRNNLSESIDTVHTTVSPGTRRTKRCRQASGLLQYNTSYYPTYSIGNTDTYLDKSEDMPLFKPKPKILEEIVILDDELEDEKVTVNVNWQNFEVFKFHLCQFENLTQIYDFFAEKENVSENRLYFAYNDEVLSCNNTLDSIKYKIATFIEGGLLSPDIINLVTENFSSTPSGIQIKFQCQNVKRPYELAVQPNDKLSLAMTKCAEHFKKPLYNLKFEFDGEEIIGTTTAKKLDLENGDCIDIRIIK